MTADTETIREALEAAVAMDAEWWNMEHSAALAALGRVEERERKMVRVLSETLYGGWNGDLARDAAALLKDAPQ